MTHDIIIRTTILDWPEWSIAFVEYSGGDVAVSVKHGHDDSFGTVVKSLEEATAYAQVSIRTLRELLKMRGPWS